MDSLTSTRRLIMTYAYRQRVKALSAIVRDHKMRALVVATGDGALAEAGDSSTSNNIHSARKSMLSVLIGQLVDAGRLDLDLTLGTLASMTMVSSARWSGTPRSGIAEFVIRCISSPVEIGQTPPSRGTNRSSASRDICAGRPDGLQQLGL